MPVPPALVAEIVYEILNVVTVLIPEMTPLLKTKPEGRAGEIDHVTTALPVFAGVNVGIVVFTVATTEFGL